MNTYFSSDFHLAHKNIIKYDNRPFDTIQQMDDTILDNCCNLFNPGDNFYFLGDFCLGYNNIGEEYMKDLQSTGVNMFFIKGNHDKHDTLKLYQKYGTYLGEQKKIKVGEQEIVLNHFSMRTWDKMHHNTLHLYGHSHDNLEKFPHGKSMDCGVVTANRLKGSYSPFEYSEIKLILDKRETVLLDHH